MRTIISLFLLVTSLSVLAQPDFKRLIEENSYPVSHDFKGRGWDFLIENGSRVDFFLIGEDHGIAQVPQITKALFQSLHKHDYEHLAIETGPFTAEVLTQLLDENNPDRTRAFFISNPFSVPFYGTEEELELLRTVHRLSKAWKPIWGLDQEFILSARALFPFYTKEFRDQDFINEQLQKAHEGYRYIAETKNPEKIWLVNQTPESLDHLAQLAASEKGKQLIAELKKSLEIYQLFFSGKVNDNNQARADHFIEWFEKYWAKATEGTRVMIKMGSTHTMKGESFFKVRDIGDYLAGNDERKTFHLALVATSGFQNMYVPFRDRSSIKTPIDTNSGHLKGLLEFVGQVGPHNGMWVLDVRPLRPYINELPDDDFLHKFITGYDAILFFPDATPATLIE